MSPWISVYNIQCLRQDTFISNNSHVFFFLESGALNRSQPVKVSRPLPIQPAPIHPDLLIQPSSVTQAPLERKSFLTKEWTIPDRPKPGRKPKEVLNTVPN